MPAKARKMDLDELSAKFKERNNRDPRDAQELVQFSKKLRGVAPPTPGEARRYMEAKKRRRGRRRPQQEEKATEEKQPAEPTASETDAATESTEPTYQVGDEVTLTKDRTGIIRFVGEVAFAEGILYGIELHPQFVGNCDGSKGEERYFECPPQKGIFVQEKKIRRKMTRSDHARKESWLTANAERNSKAGMTPEPNAPASAEPSVEPVAEEDKEAEPEAEPPAEEQPQEAAAEEPAEEPVEEPPEEPAEEPVAEESEASEEQKEENAEEIPPADEDAGQEDAPDEAGDEEAEVKAEEIDEEPPVDEEPQQEEIPATTGTEEERLVVDDYYPAKEGDNILQFLANQPDLNLRSEMMDYFMQAKTVQRLQLVFENLKPFSPDEQKNLLLADLLPRLQQFADQ